MGSAPRRSVDPGGGFAPRAHGSRTAHRRHGLEDLTARLRPAASVDNAIPTILALGGSTNAVVLIAVARTPASARSTGSTLARGALVANIRPTGSS
jgi:dihydroxyacid dehydratase/phosphogluconate dehydratase